MVSVGAGLPEGVALLKSELQLVPSEFTQTVRASASVWSSMLDAYELEGSDEPGALPNEVLTYSAARLNAACNAVASDVPEPMEEYEVVKLFSAAREPTVVSSLMDMKVAEERLLHEPRAAMRAIDWLLVPGARPGLPPVLTR